MRKEFLGGVAAKEDKVIKTFVSSRSNAESALKTKPKVSDAPILYFDESQLLHVRDEARHAMP